MTPQLTQILSQLEAICSPKSIFLYGSQVRSDARPDSDYELGVLFERDKYVGRAVLKESVKDLNVSVYPFYVDDFIAGNPDTPFNKNIFLREVIASGRTIFGARIVEDMKPPAVDVLDLLSDVQFNLGYALAATISDRNGDLKSANTLFYKSCLFGTRSLIIFRTSSFPRTYPEIFSMAGKLQLGQYEQLIKSAYDARQSGLYERSMLFKNISYLNQVVLPELRACLAQTDNKVMLN